MYKAILLSIILSIAFSLTIGSLSCCPQGYVYDRDTLLCVCPTAKPYIDASGSCVACNSPSIWKNSTKTCQKCRDDQIQDNKGVCICPPQVPFNAGNKCTECPDDKPVWNGKTCVACPAGTHFDYGPHTCTVCPPGLTYVPKDRKCEISN